MLTKHYMLNSHRNRSATCITYSWRWSPLSLSLWLYSTFFHACFDYCL